jgi:hypothetical protein
MHRILLGAALVLAAAPALAQQTAGEVYQWTDASGVVHFSQTPPAAGTFRHRVITATGSAAPASSEAVAQAAAAQDNPQCTTARTNIAALQGEGPVQQDTDGDGTPDTVLDANARAAQLELARAAEKAYCTR